MIQDDNLKEVNNLIELSGSNYEIADGEPDIKGWDVETDQNEKIGKVDDMLFDTVSRLVKYIIVEVDNSMNLNHKKILIPIELAELYESDSHTNNSSILNNDVDVQEDDIDSLDGESNASQYNSLGDDNVVIVPVNIQLLKNLPAYNKGNVTHENESAIQGMFNNIENTPTASSYSNDVTNTPDQLTNSTQKLDVIEENLQVSKQSVATGGTRLTSRLIEKPIEKTIQLKDEHVTVVRTPIDRPVSSADIDAFKEEQIEMTEYSEVPVVNKEARVVEEITVTKDVSEKEEIIKETLRNTEVTTEEIKKPKSRKKNI